jgi:hypothetical protein
VATHHLGGVASIYISGNLVVTGTHNSAVVIADSPNLIVGNWISFDRPFKGIIDSLLLLDKALTGVDVGLLYDTTHWPMPLCLEIHQLLSLLRHQPNSPMENLHHNHLHNFSPVISTFSSSKCTAGVSSYFSAFTLSKQSTCV